MRSKTFFLIIVVIFLFSLFELVNEVGRRYKISREISQQTERIEQLKKENGDLSNLINYLNTDQFVEKEARDKLGLSKSGESAVVFVSSGTPMTATSTVTINNLNKWWDYFFR